jgi:type I restriction enzyme S subunit
MCQSVHLPGIGEIPAHWSAKPLKQLASVQLSNVDKLSEEGEEPVFLCNYVDVYKHDFIRAGQDFMPATAKPSEIERFELREGDVLITKDSETWDDIGVPALIVEDLPGVLCGYHLAMLRPLPGVIDGAYLYWALESRVGALQFHTAATGVTRFGISKADVKNVVIPLPSLPEQRAIARYLTRAHRQVTRLIRNKRRLIALLNEEKQAIIQQAVTRGLDPDVAMKPSGVEWLGEIPANWEVVALRRHCNSYCDGPFGSGLKSAHYVPSGIRVVRLQNIGFGDFRASDEAFISPDHYEKLGDHDVIEGDILIAGLGDLRSSPGRACVAPKAITPAMVKADCFRFRPIRDKMLPQFMAFQLSATAPVAGYMLSNGATRQRVNLSAMAGRAVAVPPLGEQ